MVLYAAENEALWVTSNMVGRVHQFYQLMNDCSVCIACMYFCVLVTFCQLYFTVGFNMFTMTVWKKGILFYFGMYDNLFNSFVMFHKNKMLTGLKHEQRVKTKQKQKPMATASPVFE